MKGYYNGTSTFQDGRVITDKAVADYTVKHMRPENQKDIRRIVECGLLSFSYLSGSVEAPEEPWFYYDDLEQEEGHE